MSYKKNRKILIENQLEEFGYTFCQHCGISTAFKFHVHHIYFRSEYPKHKYLHDINNLIILCDKCHEKFHGNKSIRNEIIKKRNLTQLFK